MRKILDTTGRLVAAPNMDDITDFDPAKFGLVELPSAEWNGFVWVWFGDEGIGPEKPVSEFLAPPGQIARDWSLSELRIGAQLEYTVAANWKLMFQNYNDCYHCLIVHPVLNQISPYLDSSNLFEEGPILGGPMGFSEKAETMSNTGKLVGTILPGLDPRQQRSVAYFTLFPTIFFAPHPDYVLIHYLERQSPGSTHVTCDFLFPPDALNREGFDLKEAVELWDLTSRQGWRVCRLGQIGMSDRGYIPGQYSNLESIFTAFDHHYLHVMIA